ncbi:MAG: hypothetical protein D6797_05040, partial [Bdellovibrio sp.]
MKGFNISETYLKNFKTILYAFFLIYLTSCQLADNRIRGYIGLPQTGNPSKNCVFKTNTEFYTAPQNNTCYTSLADNYVKSVYVDSSGVI